MTDALPLRRTRLDSPADPTDDLIRVLWPDATRAETVREAMDRGTRAELRRNGRAYLSDINAIYGVSREDLEQWNVHLALRLEDLADRVNARDTRLSWALFVGFLIAELALITLIVFVFEPMRLPH